jgi:hypothetical protein
MVFHYRGEAFDQRRNKRYRIHALAKIEPLNDDDTHMAPVGVTIHDVGLTGMMLRLDQPVAVGSAWRLCLFDAGRLLTSIPTIIRYCQPEGAGRYRAGVQVMLDPYFLTWLGVSRRDLAVEELGTEDRFTCAHSPGSRT